MKNSFVNQSSESIKSITPALTCVVLFLRAMWFSRKSKGIMRIFPDQLNSHISKQATKHGTQIFWWPSMDWGVNGAKLQFVQKVYADSFSGRGGIDYWMNLFFKFDKGKYATRSKHLKHDWYLTQVEEVCSNVIFKSARFCTSLFERLLDKFARVGLPDTIAKIFSLRPARTDSKSFWRLYDNNACIKHWFRENAIKQYNKESYLIRTETTISNPKSLGGFKNLSFIYSHACGPASDAMTVF